MSIAKQSAILDSLAKDGKLNQFIQTAMAGEKNYTVRGGEVKFGGVEKLLANANSTHSIPYPPYAEANFSAAQQKNLFNAVAQGLDDPQAFANFKNNTKAKDSLSQLFINNRDELLLDSQKNSKGDNSCVIGDDFENGLEHFFQYALLTGPKGEKYEQLSASVFTFIKDAQTDLQSVGADPQKVDPKTGLTAYQTFINDHKGMTPEAYAQTLGGVLGSVVDATGLAQESTNRDQKAQEENIKFFTGLAFAMIPGVGAHIAGGVTNEIFKHFVEKGAEYLQGQATDKFKEALDNALTGKGSNDASDINAAAQALYTLMKQNLPLGDAPQGNPSKPNLDLQGYFDRGFRDTSSYTRFDAAAANGN